MVRKEEPTFLAVLVCDEPAITKEVPYMITRLSLYRIWSHPLKPLIEWLRLIYLVDIVIYSKTLKEHVEYLKQVFLVLRENELFVKEKKCLFAKIEVPFLCHIIGGGKIWMDRDKVRAIDECPLTELLKKDKAWDWGSKCQSAFDDIKLAMISEPFLVLPDHTKPFEVFTDASDVIIGGVLMQDGHPVAYESWKLNEIERRYMHKLGKVNFMVDALSRRYDMEFVSLLTGRMWERIKEGLSHDPMATSLIELANEGKTLKFWLDGGLFIMVMIDRFSKYETLFQRPKYVQPRRLFVFFSRLVRRYEGMFKVLKQVSTMAYRLELPSTIRAHPVFHVSLLKSYHQDKEEPDRGKLNRAPVGVNVSSNREVDTIHAERAIHGVGKWPRHEYLVQWKGLPESEGSWEPFEALWQFQQKINQFHSSRAIRASLELVGENVTNR
ncbi:hypothetical protein F3Y22_tig00110912pilonHSYRG00073 [Hibiscus syriacus]|uniref:Chromo domain-containing protein n=1 Tax=Hibiscus syriacus TaxID=106335 RepID=A0A6A2ZEY6_HIBSY|nr:hypothetical protein F3Y22_tig00110912pilonHSYRG00073 [Hibiscus syriacus]